MGGAGQVPPKLARQLGDAVVLNAFVRSIGQDANGVTVSTDGAQYRGQHVIVAMPPHLTAAISFTPTLPAERLALVQSMPMGVIAKVACIYPEAWWRPMGLSGTAQGDLPTVNATADSGPPSGRPGILTSFVQGQRLYPWSVMSPARRRQAVLDDLVVYFGAQAGQPAQYIEKIWPADPLTEGAYNAYMPPGGWTSYGPALRTPVGRIHWAGTETATQWFGYFDGAVSAGEAAAKAVMS